MTTDACATGQYGLSAPSRTSAHGGSFVTVLFAPLQAAMAAPAVLYLATLTVFLFRPPALEFHFVDRIVFGLLVLVVGLRGMVLHQSLPRSELTWSMACLAVLAIAGMVHHCQR